MQTRIGETDSAAVAKGETMGMAERASQRRKRIVVHRAHGWEDAERWDLEYWQKQTPQARLSALVAIREDIRRVKGKRVLARRRPSRRDR